MFCMVCACRCSNCWVPYIFCLFLVSGFIYLLLLFKHYFPEFKPEIKSKDNTATAIKSRVQLCNTCIVLYWRGKTPSIWEVCLFIISHMWNKYTFVCLRIWKMCRTPKLLSLEIKFKLLCIIYVRFLTSSSLLSVTFLLNFSAELSLRWS